MEGIFLKILEMNMAGTVCILFVLVLRMLLRKKPRSFSYVLWAVVFLRLLCPFALQSRYFGLTLGNMEQMLESAAYEQELVQYQLLVHKDGSVESMARRNVLGTPPAQVGETAAETFRPHTPGGNFLLQEEAWGVDQGSGVYSNQKELINRRYSRSTMLKLERSWVTVCSFIWAAGAAALLGYSLISYLLLHRRLRQAVRVQEDVYESDRISTPFLLGILDPRIYLPVGLPQEERAYVLAHELVHLKRGDYLVKVVTWLALSLHWFNPLVWLAYAFMTRDMEMSCDERVIGRLGEGSKKAYSQALLTISGLSGENSGNHLLISPPLSFGENDIRSRVKNILAYRSVKVGTRVALGLLMAAAGLVLLTDWQISGEEARQESAMGVDVNAAVGKQQENSGFGLFEETELSTEGQLPAEETVVVPGRDPSDGGGYYLVDGKAEALEERILDPLDNLREMDRGSEMTWEQLQTLAEKMDPQLEDYAGYTGAVWPETDAADDHSLTGYFSYPLYDSDTGHSYRLDIYYIKENLKLDSVYLLRESDRDSRMLYWDRVADGKGLYRYTEIDAFRRDIHRISDWVSSWEMPHEELVQVGDYMADLITGGGVIFTWKEEERDLKDAWAPEEWKSAGAFTRVAIEETEETEFGYNTVPFVFDDKGRLIDLRLMMNHSDYNGSAEALTGCQEQAVLVSMNHDLYTVSELYDLAEAGTPVPEEEATADFWYIGFARKDTPYGYVLSLSERYFTKEEAVAMARSIRFNEAAWAAADNASP